MARRKNPRGQICKYRGITLHSLLELDVIKALYRDRRKLKKAFKFGYEVEQLNYTIEGKYTPDFLVTLENGHKIYVEVKGYLDDVTKRKMLAVRRTHPDLDIRFLFEKNNKIRRGSKMTYIDWAMRNGFNGAAVGREVPAEWLLPTKEEK